MKIARGIVAQIYWVSWFLLRVVVTFYFRLQARGVENVPREGAFLVAANHASFLDPLFAGLVVRRKLYFLARRSLFKNPLFGGAIRLHNAIPVNRTGVSKEAIKIMLEHLRQGHPFVVFAEGTRSSDGELAPLRSGVVRIAQMSGVPVLPCYITGSNRALGRGMGFPRPVKVRTRYGEPMKFARDDDPEVCVEELRKRLLALAEEDRS